MKGPVEAINGFLAALDRLEIPYVIGGSVAGAAHGLPRSTIDMDVVVQLPPDAVPSLAQALGPDYLVDAAQITNAFGEGRSANILYLPWLFKFDLFPLQKDEYSQVAFARREWREVRPDGVTAIECAVSAAEDVILRKLEWYRMGGELSDRQWNDVRNIIGATSDRLDMNYLRRWAERLGVVDLLDKLRP